MHLRFSLLGVPVTLRPLALGAGMLSALLVALLSRERRVAFGAAAGVLWYTADLAHVVGHIVSSRAVGAPMDGVDFGLFPASVYAEHDVTPQQHIGRASGGLIATFLVALVLSVLARVVTVQPARKLLAISAAQHGFVLAVCLLPVELVDGGVIYKNMRKLMG